MKSKTSQDIDIQYLLELFTITNKPRGLVWGKRPRNHFASKQAHSAWNTKYAHKPAGSINSGGSYMVRILGTNYSANVIYNRIEDHIKNQK